MAVILRCEAAKLPNLEGWRPAVSFEARRTTSGSLLRMTAGGTE